MSIRKKFISLTSPFTSTLPLGFLSAWTRQDFIIPFYHIVTDGDAPHIRHLYRFKNVKQFEADLDYLTKHYLPIAATDLPDVLAGKYKGKKIMLLTFDDGLRQMYEVVAPILLCRGIPAVFFINNDFINNKALMFRYQMSISMDGPPLTLAEEKGIEKTIGPSLAQKSEAFLKEYKPYMTTEQIKWLAAQGFDIGAHSLSHPYYSSLTETEQLRQTLSSVDDLQNTFELKQRLFAFPFTDDGVPKSFFDKVFNEGKLDFTFGGAGIKKDVHPRQLQRIPMEGWDASAEQTLKSEYLYYLLRMPFFKNTIKRQ